MKVTGWNNGSQSRSGGGYGIRLKQVDRDKYFKRQWRFVYIHVSGQGRIQVNISPSFWDYCIELRSKYIGSWMISRKYAPWRKNIPPTFDLLIIRSNIFRLF